MSVRWLSFYQMTGDCYSFKFLRRSVDAKHLICYQSEPSVFKFLGWSVLTCIYRSLTTLLLLTLTLFQLDWMQHPRELYWKDWIIVPLHLVGISINPLTPGTFCIKCVFWTFWWFLGWISANLALLRSKMRLQHSSLSFLPSALRFSALWLGHAQKSKFWESDLRL